MLLLLKRMILPLKMMTFDRCASAANCIGTNAAGDCVCYSS